MKKLNSKGFTHHVTMLAILVLVLGAMGFAGYRVYQRRNIDAQASFLSKIYSPYPYRGVTFSACKTSINLTYTIKIVGVRTNLNIYKINATRLTGEGGGVYGGPWKNNQSQINITVVGDQRIGLYFLTPGTPSPVYQYGEFKPSSIKSYC